MELDHTFSFGRARASGPLAVARHGFNAVPLHDRVIEEQIVYASSFMTSLSCRRFRSWLSLSIVTL